MTSDYTIARKREYERRFGPYNDDDFRSPDDCPDDRRELVAEIKVSAAAVPLSDHLLDSHTATILCPSASSWSRSSTRSSSGTTIFRATIKRP
jgi:hypothetical protein